MDKIQYSFQMRTKCRLYFPKLVLRKSKILQKKIKNIDICVLHIAGKA